MNGHNVNTRSTFLVLSVIDHNSRHELHMGVRIGGKVLPHDLLCMRLSSNFILERNNLITSNQQIGFLEKFGEILWIDAFMNCSVRQNIRIPHCESSYSSPQREPKRDLQDQTWKFCFRRFQRHRTRIGHQLDP